jgi:hypothetical protein
VLGALACSSALAQLKAPSGKPHLGAPAARSPEVDPEVVEALFGCVAPGLPKDWARAWINITSVGSYDTFLAEFHVATAPEDRKGQPLDSACGASEMGTILQQLNRHLSAAQKKWPKARVTFMRDGKYEVHFDKP